MTVVTATLASMAASTAWLLEGFLRATWQASALVLIVLLIQWAMRRQLSHRWRYNLWLLVLIRLMLPVTPASSLSLFNLLHARPVPPAISVPIAASAGPAVEVVRIDSPIHSNVRIFKPDIPVAQISKKGSIPVFAMVWLAGVLAVAGRIVVGSVKLARRVRALAEVADARVLDALEDAKREMGVTRALPVLAAPIVASPALVGVIRPRLLLPPEVIENFDPAELRLIFLHELAHLRRRDVAVNWLASILLAVHWFNPFVWLAAARMRGDRELACDELVLSVAGGGQRDAYGQTILKLLQALSHPPAGDRTSAVLPRMVGVLGILESNHPLKRRIAMIANFTRSGSTRWTTLAAVVVMSLIATVALTDRVSADPQDGKNDPVAGAGGDDAKTQAAGHATVAAATTVDVTSADPEAATARSLRKLREVAPQPFKFDAVPLGDVIDFFRDTTKLNVFANWPALAAAGIDRNTPVTLNLNGVTYDQALQYVVRQVVAGQPVTEQPSAGSPGFGGVRPGGPEGIPGGFVGGVASGPRPLAGGLDFSVEAGVLNISTREDLARYYKVKVYELPPPRPRAGAAASTQPEPPEIAMQRQQSQAFELLQLIMQNVSPQSWEGEGAGTIRPFNNKLVIKTSEANHQKVTALLKDLSAEEK